MQLTRVPSGSGKRLRVYLNSDLNVWASIHRFDDTSSKRNFDWSDWENDVADFNFWRWRTIVHPERAPDRPAPESSGSRVCRRSPKSRPRESPFRPGKTGKVSWYRLETRRRGCSP